MQRDAILKLPAIRQLYRYRYERNFAGPGMGTFCGVYASFADAVAHAPKTKPIGYDHPGPAELYRERLDRLYANDYPVLFWLQQLLQKDCRRVFDVGGHVGVAFYSYQKLLTFPSDLTWTVYDVPKVREAGVKLSEERGVSERLRFATDISESDGADLLLAAGSLQYVESPSLAESLAKLTRLPRFILINKTPLTPGPGYVTLQNIGPAFCPYVVFNDVEFIQSLERLGYQLRDRWENPEQACYLPLDPERSVRAYSGLYLELRA